ncbi:hypothetical protein INT47_001332 [Mucor saturninus]|uniref:Poly(A) RNA polymerase mitochondrial-like central palm domain-containing protein n=1 Tax=Mucor saturninus TaxID=64648 RepID=A0A8H7QPU7_9FUNG|nr:hypothetical protein INT47_001332 [Mucor saturninus]
MNIDISFEVLEEIIQFVSDNNIAQTGKKRHLKFNMPTAFEILERNYSNLYSFLMEKGRQVVREEWNNRLKYEVMILQRYKNDKRFNTGYFPELKRDLHQGSNLFVIYLLDTEKKIYGPIKEYYLITESLTDQIDLCCEQHFLPLRSYLIRNDIRDRVNAMVQEVFSGTQATVELIGSSHTQLAMAESDVNLGIRIPKNMVTADAYLCNSSNWTKSVYDVHFLAQSLREMGMVAPFPIPLAKICKFVDPASRLYCAVGVDAGLVFERDHLIAEYLKLDRRVRPLISAILYFTRSQKINKFKLYVWDN